MRILVWFRYQITERRFFEPMMWSSCFLRPRHMIHMGSDHRCVMATFVITTPKKDGHRKTNKDKLEITKQDIRKQIDKRTGKEDSEWKQKRKQKKQVENSLNIACYQTRRRSRSSRMTWARRNRLTTRSRKAPRTQQEKQVKNSVNITHKETR